LRIVWKPYALAVLVTLAGVAITRATWPVFSIAPFAPVFGAVAVATHWGNGRAGLLAIALAVAGIALAFPSTPGFPWNPVSFAGFAAIALIGSRLIDGRNRATAALHAREAELRATLENVRASEERVRRAQKMEAVGQLAAGVAHNFNNLLQVTLGYTDVLLDNARDDHQRHAVTEIRSATERGAALTRQLMAFGRQHEPSVVRVDLDATVSRLHDMLARLVREDIDLRLTLEGRGAVVVLDPSDFEQIVINLVINARDAMPAGGRIEVTTDTVAVGRDGVANAGHAPPGDYGRLRVVDNGTGMSADVQAHLFEPFFTTKEVGEGTGLGLSIALGVAIAHGGALELRPTAKGACFQLTLPARPAPVAVSRDGVSV